MKITIRKKLFILVGIIIGTYTLAVAFIVYGFNEKLTNDARQITLAYLNESASSARAILNEDFAIARTIASTLVRTLHTENTSREFLTGEILSGTVKQNKRYLSAWVSLELSAIDTGWHQSYGRKRYTYYQSGAPVLDTVNLKGDVPGSLYYLLKKSQKEELTEPYLLSSTSSIKDNRNDFMGTSICVPLVKDHSFIGLAGMDITLEALDFIAKLKPYAGAKSFLLSNEGVIVSHESASLIGKPLSRLITIDTASISQSIKHGKSITMLAQLENEDALLAFIPVPIGVSDKPWSIGTIVPMSAITSDINAMLIKTIFVSAGGLIVLIMAVMIISGRITGPINKINQRLKEFAKGQIRRNSSLEIKSNDEIGEMIHSMNILEANLHDKIRFAVDIGAGKFNTSFTLAGEDDTLGQALETMRSNLKQFRDQEEKRIWANDGLAKLNDVLRTNAEGEEFYHSLLRTLIQFVQANQGALFLVEDDELSGERAIELVAAYAYDRKKYVTRKFAWGQSMVGQCLIEGEVVYLKQIPKEHIKITSGLGEATPTVLIIIPLKTDLEVVGAIELASFRPLKDHELQFLKKGCEIISASIYNFRNAAKTRLLLERAEKVKTE